MLIKECMFFSCMLRVKFNERFGILDGYLGYAYVGLYNFVVLRIPFSSRAEALKALNKISHVLDKKEG